MPSMTAYDFGDIILVRFPFTNLNTTKKRPAVIISQQHYQQQQPDVILMAITSQIRQPTTTQDPLLNDWQEAGLLKPSQLKPLIATLEQTLIIRKMGALSRNDQQTLSQVIRTTLGGFE